MTHSPEVMAMARRIVADTIYHKPGRDFDDARAKVLNGDWDTFDHVRAALAAIIETTEAARKLALEWRDENKAAVADGDTSPSAYQLRGARVEMNAFANALKRSEHLRSGQQFRKDV